MKKRNENQGLFAEGLDVISSYVEDMDEHGNEYLQHLSGAEEAEAKYQMATDSAYLASRSLDSGQQQIANMIALMNSPWFTDQRQRDFVKQSIIGFMGIPS